MATAGTEAGIVMARHFEHAVLLAYERGAASVQLLHYRASSWRQAPGGLFATF
jgi:hypothetical protein